MIWNNADGLYIWPTILVVLFLLFMAAYSWYRRRVPGAIQFFIGCLITALWLSGSLMEHLAVDPPAKIVWMKFQALCYLPTITATTAFLLEYAAPGRWLTRRTVTLLSLPPLIFLALALTNHLHHHMWLGFTVSGPLISAQTGPAFWLFLVYGYGLSLLQVIIYLYLLQHWPYNRWPIVLMLVGHVVTRVLWLLNRFEILRSSLPLDTFLICYMYGMFAIALFVFRIFNPVALAHQAVIAQMRDGLLVLDSRGRVASLNPAAEAMLKAPKKRLWRRPVQDVFPVGVDLPGGLMSGAEQELEMRLGNGCTGADPTGIRDYRVKLTRLKDWRGFQAGSLLTLSDVTDQKLAQEKCIQQQRTLAVLRERELLARELHDSIAQVLSFAGLKIGAARQLMADGNLPSAGDQLTQLEEVMAEANADVRHYILDLHFAPLGEKSFFTTLQQYLEGFRQNYAVQVLLSIGDGATEGVFATDVQLQVFRIIQEALFNARKHGGASCVQLSFARLDGRVHIRIEDNGCGFDLQAAAGKSGHFGLQFMRERTALLGGVLRIQSAPGQGTCVELELPPMPGDAYA